MVWEKVLDGCQKYANSGAHHPPQPKTVACPHATASQSTREIRSAMEVSDIAFYLLFLFVLLSSSTAIPVSSVGVCSS
jgi:hypothetical protein